MYISSWARRETRVRRRPVVAMAIVSHRDATIVPLDPDHDHDDDSSSGGDAAGGALLMRPAARSYEPNEKASVLWMVPIIRPFIVTTSNPRTAPPTPPTPPRKRLPLPVGLTPTPRCTVVATTIVRSCAAG